MAVKTERDLPEFQRATWLKAMSAMQLKNYGYTLQLLQPVLKSHPDFLAGRQLARKAAIANTSGKRSLLSSFSGSSLGTIKIQSQLKKDPLAAIEAIEKLLETDPQGTSLNLLLRDAAMAANLPEVATFALETALDSSPKDVKLMHELARHSLQNGDPAKAAEVYHQITTINPSDLAAVKGAKDAEAAASMKKGGWEKEETTYRDLIKDKDQAVALEQQSRVVRSDEMIDNLLADLHKKAEAEPGGVDTAKKIGELYEQKEDWENAINWFQYAAALTNHSDFALVRKASDLQIKQFDLAISAREAIVASHPGTLEAEQYAAEVVTLREQRAQLLLQSAKTRVEQNPTDLQLRFELGEILVNSGQFQEAIPELQQAKSNPHIRNKALLLLGRCFEKLNMNDLALNAMSEAVKEIPAFNNEKKELLYELGLVYEKVGNKDEYLNCLKEIYNNDYEKYYTRNRGGT